MARLILSQHTFKSNLVKQRVLPILEPNLNRTFRHVDVLCNSFAGGSSGSRVLVEFNLEKDELILGRTLTLVVLLLLSQSALPGWPARGT